MIDDCLEDARRAYSQLAARMEDHHLVWHDSAARTFDHKYWQSIEQTAERYLQALTDLAEKTHQLETLMRKTPAEYD